MVSTSIRAGNAKRSDEVVIIPVRKGARNCGVPATRTGRGAHSAANAAIRKKRFSGDRRETLFVTGANGSVDVLLVGMGEDCDVELSADLGAVACRALDRLGYRGAALIAEPLGDFHRRAERIHAFVKGFTLAAYRFKLAKKPAGAASVRSLVVLTGAKDADRTEIAAAARHASVIASQAMLVRDLVNTPPDRLTPAEFAARARSVSKEFGIKFNALTPTDLKRKGMGAILAVGGGSENGPRLMVMHYNAGKKLPRVCLVGKGVTFDSGGISIKPWERMNEMKCDMAGGAVVLASLAAAARQKLPLEIIGIVPAVENMLDGKSFRPGDVVTTYSGKTIEILSTDAEGRLILSDAITYAREFKPELIVDYATLTGAVVIALGNRMAGVMGNSQKHIDAMIAAGRRVGEPAWQLPLDDYFYDAVDGDVSDYKNYSGRAGSSSTAGALLGRFAEDTPWVHMDIAGTAWSDGGTPVWHGKGATGYGVDITLAFLEDFAKGSAGLK